MSTSTQRTASVEVGVSRAEQDHRQRGARAQLGAEMRDTTRLVGGRAAGSTTTLFSPGERVRPGTSLRWAKMETVGGVSPNVGTSQLTRPEDSTRTS